MKRLCSIFCAMIALVFMISSIIFAGTEKSTGTTEKVIITNDLETEEPEVPNDSETEEPEVPNDSEAEESEVSNDLETEEPEVPNDSETEESEVSNDSEAEESEVSNDLETEEPEVPNDSEAEESEKSNDLKIEENNSVITSEFELIENSIIDSNNTKYFDIEFNNTEFLNYNPLEVSIRINNITQFDENTLNLLDNIYSPWIYFTHTESLKDSWEEINSDTLLIIGDILTNEDFSLIGVCIGNEEILIINDGRIASPKDFKYINIDFQTKTLSEVW